MKVVYRKSDVRKEVWVEWHFMEFGVYREEEVVLDIWCVCVCVSVCACMRI